VNLHTFHSSDVTKILPPLRFRIDHSPSFQDCWIHFGFMEIRTVNCRFRRTKPLSILFRGGKRELDFRRGARDTASANIGKSAYDSSCHCSTMSAFTFFSFLFIFLYSRLLVQSGVLFREGRVVLLRVVLPAATHSARVLFDSCEINILLFIIFVVFL